MLGTKILVPSNCLIIYGEYDMFIYEKDGQLRFDFNTNKPNDTPDMIIKKEDDKTVIEIGDIVLPDNSSM